MILLALVDTLFLLSSLLTFSLPRLTSPYPSDLWTYLVPYTLPIAQTCLTASVYMTITLSLERYFSVVQPLYQLSKPWLKSPVLLSLPGTETQTNLHNFRSNFSQTSSQSQV